jgi:peroxygenase
MIKIRRNLMDPFGWFAFVFEWGSMMATLALFGRITQKGMQVNDILGVIDGSIFPVLAHEYKQKKRGIALLPQRVR